jgi:hypothetical protein
MRGLRVASNPRDVRANGNQAVDRKPTLHVLEDCVEASKAAASLLPVTPRLRSRNRRRCDRVLLRGILTVRRLVFGGRQLFHPRPRVCWDCRSSRDAEVVVQTTHAGATHADQPASSSTSHSNSAFVFIAASFHTSTKASVLPAEVGGLGLERHPDGVEPIPEEI